MSQEVAIRGVTELGYEFNIVFAPHDPDHSYGGGVGRIPISEVGAVLPEQVDELTFLGSLIGGFLDRIAFTASPGVEFIPYPHVDGEHAGRTFMIAAVKPGENLRVRLLRP